MPHRRVRLVADGPVLREGFAAIRTELNIPAAAAHPRLPDALAEGVDRTDTAFLTIDPPGSMDLDQAMHIVRTPKGYRVLYAIADVAAFVTPGDPIDVEAHVRGETLYSPDMRTPLHPPVMGEGAASLLPDQTRPALLWTINL